MDENATTAINMAFAVFVLVIALSLAIFMFSMVASTSEALVFYSDSTVYYDNVELIKYCATCNASNPAKNKFCDSCRAEFSDTEDSLAKGTARIVSAETIIPTLYRYYKENFCVKICDASGNLIQIFDVFLEGKANSAWGDKSYETAPNLTVSMIQNKAYNAIFGDEEHYRQYFLNGAPWLGNPELVKLRLDLFINGKGGFINNKYIDYTGNAFHQAILDGKNFKEEFINYSYTGQTIETEDGDSLVVGASAKDKTVIIYTMLP